LTDFFQRIKLSIDITLEKKNQSIIRFVHHINRKKKKSFQQINDNYSINVPYGQISLYIADSKKKKAAVETLDHSNENICFNSDYFLFITKIAFHEH
jgi:hypothetical protein